MVGRLVLVQLIGVRIPVPEHEKITLINSVIFLYIHGFVVC